MLLFRPEHVPMVLAGTKWQTRRLWKTARAKVGSLHKCYSGGLPISKCPDCGGTGRPLDAWDIAGVYCRTCYGNGTLQPFATIHVLDVWQEPLLDISEADARAEGYPSSADFLAAFGRINNVSANQMIYLVPFAVEFELNDG